MKPSLLAMVGCGYLAATLLTGIASAQAPLPPIDPVIYHEPWYVKTNGNNGLDGRSWATAFATVERALLAVEPDGQIWVAQGTYSSSSPRIITKPIQLYGGFIGTETRIGQRPPPGAAPTNIQGFSNPQNRPAHVFYITEIADASQVVIDRVLLRYGDGLAPGVDGGGIAAPCANLVLSDVTVTECSGYFYGGGITFGGGCANPNSWRRLSMKNCTIRLNFADWYGGGLGVIHGFGEVVNTRFEENGCGFSGGAAHLMHQDASHRINFAGCDFSDNLCFGVYPSGAGALSLHTLYDPTIVGHAELTNCTFHGNVLQNYGDGGAVSMGWNSLCTIRNSIVWGNSGTFEVLGPLVSVSNSAGDSAWCPAGNNNLLDTNPLFVSATDLDLQASSPCIDKGRPLFLPVDILDVDWDGNTSEALPLDILRRPRSVDNPGVTGVLDMGAYERPYP